MKKILFSITIALFTFCASAQEGGKPTGSFTVTGKVKATKTFTWDEIDKMKAKPIGDVDISNHKGDPKGTTKAMTGVLLTDVIASVEFDAESPKTLSEFYLICTASDGYKVVYSWNELYNTDTGASVFIVVTKDNLSMKDSKDNLLMISSKDKRTGRRYLKNLQSITVERVK